MMTRQTFFKILASATLLSTPLFAQKFYPDDPLTAEPPPFQTESANYRSVNYLWEVFENIFTDPGERQPENGVIPAEGVNTMGEVMDGLWFVNRHGRKRLSAEELTRGAGDAVPPSRDEPWRVLTVKKYDIKRGILVADSKNDIYLLRFDPTGQLEMATGAGMIGSRLYHAMGYWVAENYLVHFDRSQLVASPEGEDINAVGDAVQLMEEDIDLFLAKTPRDKIRGFRAVAIRVPKGVEIIGPYQYFGTRSDDPNDIVPHEHRRDLRGLHVISAWLGNNFIGAIQNQDGLVQENGVYQIRHYVVDFFNLLGSGLDQAKHSREGYEPVFDLDLTAKNFGGFGVYAPAWQRASYPSDRALGLFEYETFDPATWIANYDVAALANRLPDDNYWAAKLILSFTDEDILAIVKVAEYSNPSVENWIAKCLIERRDKIGRHFLDQVLPLDNFRLEGDELKYDDLAETHGFRGPEAHTVEWFQFRNMPADLNAFTGYTSFAIPERAKDADAGSYFAAKISGETEGKTVTVYLRKEESEFKIVGVDRDWPGKVIAASNQDLGEAVESRYAELTPRKKELFDRYTADYNEKTGFGITPEQSFAMLTISERTTFDAVTNALEQSKLTDAEGNSLGVALDLVAGIERIAGQYYGRQGDEQFRLYCFLKPEARDILEKSQEFALAHENTVYHVGYPFSYRQAGKVPNIQFSMSEEGLRADIDVDYRSSKMPDAMWNGHLTSANSDVRAGDNYDRHNNRWSGLVNWWQGVFGRLPGEEKDTRDLLSKEPPEPATPLPPDRPANASIPEVYDAVQEFLTDWLVRRHYDEALTFVSDQAMACVKIDDAATQKSLSPAEVRTQLRKTLRAVAEESGRFENLTEAIDAVVPWRKAFRPVKQPFEGDFAMVEAPDAFAEFFRCESRDRSRESQIASLSGELKYGNYYGAVFRFKVGNSRGGVLALLWAKESGVWRLISWEVLDQ